MWKWLAWLENGYNNTDGKKFNHVTLVNTLVFVPYCFVFEMAQDPNNLFSNKCACDAIMLCGSVLFHGSYYEFIVNLRVVDLPLLFYYQLVSFHHDISISQKCILCHSYTLVEGSLLESRDGSHLLICASLFIWTILSLFQPLM
jgi:hypothetical protein